MLVPLSSILIDINLEKIDSRIRLHGPLSPQLFIDLQKIDSRLSILAWYGFIEPIHWSPSITCNI